VRGNLNSTAIELVKLRPLMERTSGRAEILIGLIDGPVAMDLPELASGSLHEVRGDTAAACSRASSAACAHGTFVAGMLAAQRGSAAAAICPGCSLVIRPIFREVEPHDEVPSASAHELARAIDEVLSAGVRLINLSAALAQPSPVHERELEGVLNSAARRGVMVVAAAGNQGALGSTAITRHPWVIPVAACDYQGRLTRESNLGSSIGRRGLRAPGEGIVSLAAEGGMRTFGGTSAATPFVTGTIALLLSRFPSAAAAEVQYAVLESATGARGTVVPRLLNAWAAHEILASLQPRVT